MSASHSKYFLPYQQRWLADRSPVKIWEKSRRIGATYVQAYEDVRDCLPRKLDVWFSSADESAAREYILYAEQWARLFHAAAEYLGEQVIDQEKDIKAFVLALANGSRINALSSSPRRFRSKGGKVILDEFGWHDDQEGMWAAAIPATTWGFDLRILSTYNGKGNLYWRYVEDVKNGKRPWSLHTTTIQTAVEEGILDKIMGRPTTPEERAAWLDETRLKAGSESRWQQEYCCVPVDEATAFLSYQMIAACERRDILLPLDGIAGDLYVGMDIARRKHLSVIWGVERVGHALYTRIYKVMEKAPFRHQREALFEILRHPRMRRACIDATGLGMQLAEEAQEQFGKFRVEAVTFTGAVKEQMASGLLPYFEDRALFIPDDERVREDLHSIRKVTTLAGNVRYDVAKTEEEAHADRFWALALAVHAAGDKASGPIHVVSRATRSTAESLRGFGSSDLKGL